MFSKLKQNADKLKLAKQMQKALSTTRTEGTSGWGKVKVIMDGSMQVQEIVVDESLYADHKTLLGHIKDATNDAVRKAMRTMESTLKNIGGEDVAKEMQELQGK